MWRRTMRDEAAARLMTARRGMLGYRPQPEKEEADRGMLRLAEDHRADAQGAASRGVQGRLDLYLRLRRLQSGAHAESEPVAV